MSSFLNKGPSKSGPKKSGKTFSGNKTWFVFAIVAAVAAAGIVFAILSNIVATTTYYVLNKDVPSRSQIVPDMLSPVVASKGSEPRNALSLEDVTFNAVYAKFALNTGDILTVSNTGDLIPLQQGIPDDYVVASFVVDANNAVAGKLATGNYIDIISTSSASDNAIAKYSLRHVLVMDVSSDPGSIGENQSGTVDADGNVTASNSDQLRQGVPTLYTVALPQGDAATLALIRDSNLLVVLSPKESDKKFVDANITKTEGQIYSDTPVTDSGKGTDNSFGQAKKEEAAKPTTDPTTAPSATPTDQPAPETTTEAPAGE